MPGDRPQFSTALGLSAGVNVLLFLAVAWAMGVSRGFHGPVGPLSESPAFESPPEETMVVLSAEPEPAAPPPPEKYFVASVPGQKDVKPDTKNPRFFSNQNMKAAAELEASPDGVEGLATTEGKDDRPTLDLRDNNFKDGEDLPRAPSAATPQPPADAASVKARQAPQEQPATEAPPPEPELQTPEEALSKSDKPPEKSSERQDKSEIAKDDNAEKPPESAPLAFRDNTADTIAPIPETPALPPARRPKPSTPLTRIPDQVPDYQPGLKKTKKLGKISNKGIASVDAVATAEGRFNAAIRTAIEKNWRLRISTLAGLANPGLVEVEFEIDGKGRVSGVKLANPGEANPIMQDCALTAVINAKIPPPPAELLENLIDPLTGGRLRCSFSFLIY